MILCFTALTSFCILLYTCANVICIKFLLTYLLNTAKFGWRPLRQCRAVPLPRHETHWNVQGCPKLLNRSQPLVGRSSPYYEYIWRRYCCLTSFFFRLSIPVSVAKIQPNKVVRWCPDGNFLRHFCTLYLQRAACSTFQTCILNLN